MWNSNDFIPSTDKYNVRHKYVCVSFIAGFHCNGLKHADRGPPKACQILREPQIHCILDTERRPAQRPEFCLNNGKAFSLEPQGSTSFAIPGH